MPRAASPNSCKTCRTRKVKCDGTLPQCLRCQKQDLFCDRSKKLNIKPYPLSNVFLTGDREQSPRQLLQQSDIATLFHIYIKELAPWYDLNDSQNCSFGNLASAAALESPLLFAAIIAFAGVYASRKYRTPINVAETYHERCLHFLILLTADDQTINNGVALAATCSLRSYEILAEREDPNRHLFGASTLVPATPSLSHRGLLPCGFWNYLREDITYSLIHECPLKIQVKPSVDLPVSDGDHANAITLILGALVNSFFGPSPVDVELSTALEQWRSRFVAMPYSRCESDVFPAVRMLKDCHVSAMHYYHVAVSMLKPKSRSSSATEICALAIGADSDPVTVNAYGPICFTAKWLTDGSQRRSIISWLRNTQKRTAWSVEILISKLQKFWMSDTY